MQMLEISFFLKDEAAQHHAFELSEFSIHHRPYLNFLSYTKKSAAAAPFFIRRSIHNVLSLEI